MACVTGQCCANFCELRDLLMADSAITGALRTILRYGPLVAIVLIGWTRTRPTPKLRDLLHL